jgi:hypothetical protein
MTSRSLPFDDRICPLLSGYSENLTEVGYHISCEG